MKTNLVLLSGLLSNKVLWQHQTLHLSDLAAIQIISSSQDTPKKMVQAILKEAPAKFALAGHSMGGWLCLEVMRAAPSRVSKLCLLNTTARSDSQEKKNRRQEMVQKAQRGEFPKVVEEIVDALVFNPLVKDAVRKMFLGMGSDVFIHQELSMLQREECQSILPTIACPTLVIHAGCDKNFFLEEHKELVNQIRDAKLAIVDDSGHMSPMEMPQAITTLLRYWLSY